MKFTNLSDSSSFKALFLFYFPNFDFFSVSKWWIEIEIDTFPSKSWGKQYDDKVMNLITLCGIRIYKFENNKKRVLKLKLGKKCSEK